MADQSNHYGGITKVEIIDKIDSLGTHDSYGMRVHFNASWVNPIYGNSTTVQPKAYTVMYIMKIK